VLGIVAYRTGSVLPGVLVHFTNNAMSVSLERFASSGLTGVESFLSVSETGIRYQTWWLVTSATMSVFIFWYIIRYLSVKTVPLNGDPNTGNGSGQNIASGGYPNRQAKSHFSTAE
jgi:hypothetical protein